MSRISQELYLELWEIVDQDFDFRDPETFIEYNDTWVRIELKPSSERDLRVWASIVLGQLELSFPDEKLTAECTRRLVEFYKS